MDKILVKRGNSAQFGPVTLDAGEPAFVIDTQDFYVGDGTTKVHINAIKSKSDIGLGNVDNTSDLNKPISTATQTALNSKLDDTQLDTNTALGVDNTKIPSQAAVKTYVDNAVSQAIAGDITIDGGAF